jgi:D-arabinose 1-dehydrogenase-like Zn-dependent alcohol dehydrogenase
VRIKVGACGICHSDSYVVNGTHPGIRYPAVPGHEIAGHIDALGPGVTSWRLGQRVGVGWHGGHCGTCANCLRGDFVLCVIAQVPGMAYDGGYADYRSRRSRRSLPSPTILPRPRRRHCSARASPRTIRSAIQARAPGIWWRYWESAGLVGHLGVQLGFRTVAIARGADKAKLAL